MKTGRINEGTARWSAVLSPSLSVIGLITAELLPISLGGFWSMCAAVTMRLVPESNVPQALLHGSGITLVLAALLIFSRMRSKAPA